MHPVGGEYFLFVFVAALGVLQVAAAYSRLDGLLLLRRRAVAGLVGLALAVGAFLWFFASGPRNVPDTQGGLDGNAQAGLFAAAAGAALAVTLVVSSLLNSRRAGGAVQGLGLDALRNTTYARALLEGARACRRMWRQWTRRLYSG